MVLAQNNYKAGKYTVQYQDCDDSTAQAGAYDPATCSSNANAYIRDSSVIGVLGTLNSPCAKLEVPVLNRVGLVEISGANTNLGLTQPSGEPGEPDKYYPSGIRNYARVVAVDNSQGAVDATLAQKLGAKSVYVLDDKESYGVGVADFFQKAATQLGIKVAGRDSWDPKAAELPGPDAEDQGGQPGRDLPGRPDLLERRPADQGQGGRAGSEHRCQADRA